VLTVIILSISFPSGNEIPGDVSYGGE